MVLKSVSVNRVQLDLSLLHQARNTETRLDSHGTGATLPRRQRIPDQWAAGWHASLPRRSWRRAPLVERHAPPRISTYIHQSHTHTLYDCRSRAATHGSSVQHMLANGLRRLQGNETKDRNSMPAATQYQHSNNGHDSPYRSRIRHHQVHVMPCMHLSILQVPLSFNVSFIHYKFLEELQWLKWLEGHSRLSAVALSDAHTGSHILHRFSKEILVKSHKFFRNICVFGALDWVTQLQFHQDIWCRKRRMVSTRW